MKRALTLVKFSGPGLGRLGATAEVVHGGKPYDTPQAWSQALRAHPIRADAVCSLQRPAMSDEAPLLRAVLRATDSGGELDREMALDSDRSLAPGRAHINGLAASLEHGRRGGFPAPGRSLDDVST